MIVAADETCCYRQERPAYRCHVADAPRYSGHIPQDKILRGLQDAERRHALKAIGQEPASKLFGNAARHRKGGGVLMSPRSTRLTGNAAGPDRADVELLLDGELAPLVEGDVFEVEVLDVHAEACRYPRHDVLERQAGREGESKRSKDGETQGEQAGEEFRNGKQNEENRSRNGKVSERREGFW